MARRKAEKPGQRVPPGATGKKRTAKRDEDPYKKATVLIPLTYNDDTQIPIDALLSIKEQLAVNFRVHTDEGTVDGEYLMQSGLKRADKLLRLCVDL